MLKDSDVPPEERFVAYYTARPTDEERLAMIRKARTLGLSVKDMRGDVRATGRPCMHYGLGNYAFEADTSERARTYGRQVLEILPGFPALEDIKIIKI